MTPNALLIEDAFALSLFITQGNDILCVALLGLGIISGEKQIRLAGLAMLVATIGANNKGRKKGGNAYARNHRPAPWPTVVRAEALALFCGVIPARKVKR